MTMHPQNTRFAILAASLLVLTVCSCGGEEEEAAAPQPQPRVAPFQQAAQQQKPKVVPKRRKTQEDDAEDETVLEVPEGHERFALGPNVNEFTTEPATDDVDPKDRFVVVRPEGGASSAHFRAIPPATDDEAEARPNPATVGTQGPDPAARLPEGFTPVEGTEITESGLPRRIVCDKDGSEMVLIEAGVFQQGRDQSEDEKEYGVESIPERAVYLDDFYIDVYEVTLERYQPYRDALEKEGRRVPPEPLNAGDPGNHPAAGITWAYAKGYATWTGRTLPTEAQWDKAARTSMSFAHPWGNGRAIWGKPRVPGRLDPVGSFPSDCTPQGVYDMAGNVREWCLDYYSDSFKDVSASEVVKNPDGPRSPSIKYHRVIKGGGPDWIVWHRTSAPMRTFEPDLGFRTVLVIPPREEDEKDGQKSGRTGKVGF